MNRIEELQHELARETARELSAAEWDRWYMVSALISTSGELLARGLGLLEASHAARLASGDPWRGTDWAMEGGGMVTVAVAAWCSLVGHNAERMRAAVAFYGDHHHTLAGVPLPGAGDEDAAWLAFFGAVARGTYTRGSSQADVVLAGWSSGEGNPPITQEHRDRARALAERDMLERLRLNHAVLRQTPTPEEAQTAPHE